MDGWTDGPFPYLLMNLSFFHPDKIPLSMNISQKHPGSITDKKVFVRGSDVIFNVQIHDPSSYLKTANAVDFIWDFRDGNQLVTHSNVATHAYNTLGNVTVKLLVEASFRVPCPPHASTPMHFTQAHTMGNLINTGTLLSQTTDILLSKPDISYSLLSIRTKCVHLSCGVKQTYAVILKAGLWSFYKIIFMCCSGA